MDFRKNLTKSQRIEKIRHHNTVYNLLLGSCLLTNILADILFGFYLLNYELNHATNHIQTRYKPFDQNYG